eukprot:183732-Amorphochlora_amoeboformis.AAC.1
MASRIKSIAWSILAASVAAQSRGVRGSVSLGSRLATRWFGSTYTRKFPSVAPRPRVPSTFLLVDEGTGKSEGTAGFVGKSFAMRQGCFRWEEALFP